MSRMLGLNCVLKVCVSCSECCQHLTDSNFPLSTEPFDLTNTARSCYDASIFERIKSVFITSYHVLKETETFESLFAKPFLSAPPHCIIYNNSANVEPSTTSQTSATARPFVPQRATVTPIPMSNLSAAPLSTTTIPSATALRKTESPLPLPFPLSWGTIQTISIPHTFVQRISSCLFMFCPRHWHWRKLVMRACIVLCCAVFVSFYSFCLSSSRPRRDLAYEIELFRLAKAENRNEEKHKTKQKKKTIFLSPQKTDKRSLTFYKWKTNRRNNRKLVARSVTQLTHFTSRLVES